ncbi:MAG: hypothetical protein AB7S74_18460, partial [Hyphomicrobium sp.]
DNKCGGTDYPMIEKPLAEKMMLGALECSEELVNILDDIQSISDSRLEKKIRHQVAHVMGVLLVHFMNPIGAIYPDLYPKALKPAPKLQKASRTKNKKVPKKIPRSRARSRIV